MKKVIIRKRLIGEDTDIGVGATINLSMATPPIIKFLRTKYSEDPACIMGDIDFLFSFRGEGLRESDKYFRN